MQLMSDIRRLATLFILIFSLGCTKAGTKTDGEGTVLGPSPVYGLNSYVININGTTRTYLFYVPASYHPGTKAALVFGFHGGGGDGASVIKTSSPTGSTTDNTILNLADNDGVLMVFPDGIDEHWNDGRQLPGVDQDDVLFTSRLIDEVAANYDVDQKRIYSFGISNGAMMSIRLACDLSNRIRAVATMVGNIPKLLMPICTPSRPVPINMFNGVNDPLVPYAGGFVKVPITGELRGEVESVDTTADFFASQNGCALTKTTTNLPDIASDGTTVTRYDYNSCPGTAEVKLYQVVGGGHTWPNGWQYVGQLIVGKTTRDITANTLIWDFFKRQGM